jgi:ParB family chromosome partitioning protein
VAKEGTAPKAGNKRAKASTRPAETRSDPELTTPKATTHSPVQPIELPLDRIDEDPNQPRTVFNQELLEELAETIRQRGVKNPISVHPNPEKSGRYVINDGARRYRASRLAGKSSIKAFIDADFTKIDQIIVNAHHETFTPREWAILIDQEEKRGKTRYQIAKELGKSPPFVTYYATLLNLPDSIAEVFNSGRCEDVTALNHLVLLWKRYPEDVEFWLEDPTIEITRASILQLRAFLESRDQKENESVVDRQEGLMRTGAKDRKPRASNPVRLHNPVMQVKTEGRIAHLLFNRRPSKFGMVWLKFQDNYTETEKPLTEIQFLGLLEG